MKKAQGQRAATVMNLAQQHGAPTLYHFGVFNRAFDHDFLPGF